MEPKNTSGYFIKIIILQCVLAAIILSATLITKYFFKDSYKYLKEWYADNIAVDTNINEVLGD